MRDTSENADLSRVLELKIGDWSHAGWSPRLRRRFGYCTPDEWYEATLFGMIDATTAWLDVGCGRNIFPSNQPAAAILARRCRLLVGVDPSDNIDENALVHERAKCLIEAYRTDRQFDLITLRMVVEHITDPAAAVASLARLTKPGGRVVVYTVHKWSPVTLISAASSLRFHHAAKKRLWDTEEKDTFPTAYRMNSRKELRRLFADVDFIEESYRHLDDCRSFTKWKLGNIAELVLWKSLRAVGLGYPEFCILGVYRKNPRY